MCDIHTAIVCNLYNIYNIYVIVVLELFWSTSFNFQPPCTSFKTVLIITVHVFSSCLRSSLFTTFFGCWRQHTENAWVFNCQIFIIFLVADWPKTSASIDAQLPLAAVSFFFGCFGLRGPFLSGRSYFSPRKEPTSRW